MNPLKNIKTVTDFNEAIQSAKLIKTPPSGGRKFSVGNGKVSMNRLVAKFKELAAQNPSDDQLSTAVINLVKLDSQMKISSNIFFKIRRLFGNLIFNRLKELNTATVGKSLSLHAQAALLIANETKSLKDESGYNLKADLLDFTKIQHPSAIRDFILKKDEKHECSIEEMRARRMQVYLLAQKLFHLKDSNASPGILLSMRERAIMMVISAGLTFGDGDESRFNSKSNLEDFNKLNDDFRQAVMERF